MVAISLYGSGEGPGWVTAPGYSTAAFSIPPAAGQPPTPAESRASSPRSGRRSPCRGHKMVTPIRPPRGVLSHAESSLSSRCERESRSVQALARARDSRLGLARSPASRGTPQALIGVDRVRVRRNVRGLLGQSHERSFRESLPFGKGPQPEFTHEQADSKSRFRTRAVIPSLLRSWRP